MTCRYGHKRVALLFTLVQATAAARVIDWPQPSQAHASERRHRAGAGNAKSQPPSEETQYASK